MLALRQGSTFPENRREIQRYVIMVNAVDWGLRQTAVDTSNSPAESGYGSWHMIHHNILPGSGLVTESESHTGYETWLRVVDHMLSCGVWAMNSALN